jgi:hypothetical protein
MHKRGTSGLFTKEKKNTNMSNSIKNSAPQPHSPQPQNKRQKKPLNEMDCKLVKQPLSTWFSGSQLKHQFSFELQESSSSSIKKFILKIQLIIDVFFQLMQLVSSS